MERNGDVDYISSLPDEILFRVISFLPFESAIQTVLLSTRWRLLWNVALIRYGPTSGIISSVFNFLTNFSGSNPTANIRKLVYRFNKGGVLLATIGPDYKVRLDFSKGKQGLSKQFGLHLGLNYRRNVHQITSCPFVKSLELVSVNCHCNEAVSSIVSGLTLLENVKIIKSKGLMSLRINSSVKLRSLTILDCPELKGLHIGCPKLRTFQYRGLFSWCRNQFHYNLKDAMFDYREGPGDNDTKCCDFDQVILTIKNVEILTLCKWTFEALICPSLSSLKADFQLYKLKELWWIDNSNEGFNCDSLISFLKLCPSLEQLFITMDPKSYNITSGATCPSQVGKHTKLARLKVVHLEGFTNQEDEIEFAMRLREVVSVDPQILATSNGKSWRSLVKILASHPQNKMKNLEVMWKDQLEERKRCYRFVEKGKVSEDFPPKHAHMYV